MNAGYCGGGLEKDPLDRTGRDGVGARDAGGVAACVKVNAHKQSP
jgi:hypothetical protein